MKYEWRVSGFQSLFLQKARRQHLRELLESIALSEGSFDELLVIDGSEKKRACIFLITHIHSSSPVVEWKKPEAANGV